MCFITTDDAEKPIYIGSSPIVISKIEFLPNDTTRDVARRAVEKHAKDAPARERREAVKTIARKIRARFIN